MIDDEAPTGPGDEAGEPWVTGKPIVAQRVPGIDEAQEATYVDPEKTSWRRAVLIGTGIGLAVTAIFAAVVLSTDSDGSSDESAVGAVATATSTTTRSTTTTTSVEWWRRATSTTTTTAPAAGTATTSPPASALAAAVAPATPRATSNPATPPFTKVALPAGVGATLTTCAWQPTNGGQYEAAGTVTNGPSTNHGWTLTMHWLQNDREIAQQSALVPLTAGQSLPWRITLSAPNPPADPFSCALTAA